MHGSVQCLRKEDCIGLEVYMNEVGITETPDKIKRTTEVLPTGQFTFNRTFQDKIYNIFIEKKHFCWIKDTQKVKVEPKTPIDSPVFQQNGYLVTYEADFDFTLQKDNGSVSTVDIKEGPGQFCLSEPGTWKLTPLSKCAIFAEEEAVVETDDANHIGFKAKLIKVSGSIVHQKEDGIRIGDISVTVAGEEAQVKRKNEGKLVYSVFLAPEKLANMKIKATSEDELLMFTVTKVKGEEGEEEVEAPCVRGKDYAISRGMMISGSINPPVVNATIKIQLGDQVIAKTLSSPDGSYSHGPLAIHESYDVYAAKDDYIIESAAEDRFAFKSQRLAKLEVRVVDAKTLKPLEGAFLSLSAGKTRITGMTGQ